MDFYRGPRNSGKAKVSTRRWNNEEGFLEGIRVLKTSGGLICGEGEASNILGGVKNFGKGVRETALCTFSTRTRHEAR